MKANVPKAHKSHNVALYQPLWAEGGSSAPPNGRVKTEEIDKPVAFNSKTDEVALS